MLIGGLNSLFDLALFTILNVGLHVNEVVANVTSTSVTMLISYFMNRGFVFRSRHTSWMTAAGFVVVTLFSGWVLQSGVVWVIITLASAIDIPLTWKLAISPAAKICAMGVGAVFNYIGYRFVFGKEYSGSQVG